MTNLEFYKNELEEYLNVGYSLSEAMDQVFDEFSNLERIYPKNEYDMIAASIRQDRKLLKWYASKCDDKKSKKTNLQRYLTDLNKAIKDPSSTLWSVLWELYFNQTVIEAIDDGNFTVMECSEEDDDDDFYDDDDDIKMLNWLLAKE